MEEVSPQARGLLDKINRQFTECNALYHVAAQQCGLSDAAFWTLYALYTNPEPQTQNRISAEWGAAQADAQFRRGGYDQKRALWRFARERAPTAASWSP